MSQGVSLATGRVERIQNLHNSSDHVYLTCSEREGDCPHSVAPSRPDDHALEFLLDHPYCVACGAELVVVPRGEYGGPEPEFRDLDREGSPVVSLL
jgi:hypothetical protein